MEVCWGFQCLPGTSPPILVGSREKGTAIAEAADIDFFVDNKTPLTCDKRVEIADRLLEEVQYALPYGRYKHQISRRAVTLRSGVDSSDYPDVDIVYAE